MRHLSDPAFPNIVPDGDPKETGLTKHELAAVIIGGHLASVFPGHLTPTGWSMIADQAYDLSKAILNKFNPTT